MVTDSAVVTRVVVGVMVGVVADVVASVVAGVARGAVAVLLDFAACDWPLPVLIGMRDWLAFPLPRDAIFISNWILNDARMNYYGTIICGLMKLFFQR